MWNEHNYNQEELKIVREFEYLYFMYNPGFRAMWRNNFEEYFKGTQDEKYWEKREEEREKEIIEDVEYNMRTDPEYASWRAELAIIEETLLGDPSESYITRSRWFEREQMMKEAEKEQWEYRRKLENDRLYQMSKDWSMALLKMAGPVYEKNKDINWFRVLTNCLSVSGKIVFAAREFGDDEEEYPCDTSEDFLWRTDRIGYILSLASLQRCLESLRKLKEKDPSLKVDKFIANGLTMQTELIDRLEEIQQNFLKKHN
jgi:hypothetical protein